MNDEENEEIVEKNELSDEDNRGEPNDWNRKIIKC